MRIKHFEIDSNESAPFANCKLGREKYATVLTSIVSTYSDGFVLAINNEWGAGKTTFLKMWQQQLNKEKFKTLYFNAWENDFDTNPLIALMSELKSLVPQKEENSYHFLLKKGAVIGKSILPTIAKAIADKYIDSKVITEAIKKTTEAATEIFIEEVDEYSKKKKGLREFRDELEKFINNNNEGKPIVFIIDELDRTRPDYAVEVLENVKHFFSVPGIVFVLSIDKIQLCNAIKGYYGSEDLNALEYLRRFIDLEYILPSPKTENYCNYLYNYFQFNDYFETSERKNVQDISNDSSDFLRFSTILFEKANLNLRMQEKIFAHTRVVLNSFKSDQNVFPALLILLVYIRFLSPEFYAKIKGRQLAIQPLIKELELKFPSDIKVNEYAIFSKTEAFFIYFYYNYYREINKVKLFGSGPVDKEPFLYESQFDNIFAPGTLINNLNSIKWQHFNALKLDFLLDKIDLIENLII